MVPKLVSILMLFAIVLSGCQYQAPLATSAADLKAKSFETSPNSSSLYVFAEDEINNPLAPMGVAPVYLNEQFVGSVSTGTFISIDVPPGRYMLSSFGGKVKRTLDLQNEQMTFASLVLSNSDWFYRIHEVDRGQKLVSSKKLSKSEKYVAGSRGRQRGSSSSGTAWVLDNCFIVTASHVVEGRSVFSLKLNGESYDLELLRADVSNDIAILRVKASGFSATGLEFATGPAQVGEEVYTLGYPLSDILGSEVRFTNGRINSLSGLAGDASRYQISVPIQPGNSGGPLLNSNGEVVGMVVSKIDEIRAARSIGTLPQGINFATKGEYIRILAKPDLRQIGGCEREPPAGQGSVASQVDRLSKSFGEITSR